MAGGACVCGDVHTRLPEKKAGFPKDPLTEDQIERTLRLGRCAGVSKTGQVP